jgi:nucleoside-diphosphate-sugar epimerase
VREDAPLLPKNLYGASKCAGEAYCMAMRVYRLETVILRLANVYGAGDRERVIPIFVENALTGAPLVLYGGQQVVDFIWVGDVVDALIRAGFGDYIHLPVNIGSGIGVTIKELASRIVSETGSPSAVRVAPPRDIEVCGFVAGVDTSRTLLAMPKRSDPLFRLGDAIECLRGDLLRRSPRVSATGR